MAPGVAAVATTRNYTGEGRAGLLTSGLTGNQEPGDRHG